MLFVFLQEMFVNVIFLIYVIFYQNKLCIGTTALSV